MLKKFKLDKVSNGIASCAAIFILILGCVVMLGWILRITALIQILPTLVPMQFNTALCFALIGSAALFKNRRVIMSALILVAAHHRNQRRRFSPCVYGRPRHH